jgi:hypothetical protein
MVVLVPALAGVLASALASPRSGVREWVFASLLVVYVPALAWCEFRCRRTVLGWMLSRAAI